uniref:Intraflagellar transport protein 140 n=1 Tax=Globodera rostochiensis TaxID=31243 RepID=A0A914H1B1_GLORO
MANFLGQNGVLLTAVWPTSTPFHDMKPFTSFNIQYAPRQCSRIPRFGCSGRQKFQHQYAPGVHVLLAVGHLRLDWHPTRDLLGVCSVMLADGDGGFVTFFTKKGGKPFFTSKIRQGNAPTCFCWHPFEPLLAVGWETGHLNVVDPTKKTEIEALDARLSEICCLLWNGDGSLLMAADTKGSICSFKCQSSEVKLEHFGSARTKEERPRAICCKQMAKHLLKRSNAPREVEKRFGGLGGEQDRDQKEETLSELLSKHKKLKELDIGATFEDEQLKAKMALSETVSVFLIGTDQGGVYLFEPHSNQLSRIFQADSGIKQLVDMPGRVHVLATTESMMFYQLAIEGKLANDKIKVKLGATSKHFQMLRVDAHTVAFCYGDREIRVWDLETEDSAILRLSAEKGFEHSDEQMLMLSYSSKKDSICGVTSKGRLATWRRIRDSFANARNDGPIPVDQQWKLASAIVLNIPNVIGMAWSHTSTAFALNSGDSVQIFFSQGIDFYVDSEFAVIQVSAQLLNLVKITDPVETQELQLHSNIRGFYVTGNHLLLWDDAKVQLDQLHCPSGSPLQISHIAAFDVQNVQQAAYHNQHVFSIIADQLFVHTLQGTVKRAIAFREIEGRPEMISVKGNWLCVATSLGYLRIYDLTESVMKLTFHSSNLHNAMPTFGKWALIKLNTAGNRVSFTIQQADDERPYERLFVWEAENDSVGYFCFHDGITDQQQYETDAVGGGHADGGTAAGQRPKTAAIRKIESEKSRFRMPSHLPGNHFWDQHDPRLLVCEAIPVSGAVYADSSTSGSLWLTMFVTAEHGIQMHDLHKKPQKADSLLFVSVPHLYFLRNIEVEEEDDPQTELRISRLILRRTMREFVGIDPQDEKAVRAMLDFAFFLCVGQMDNAFKAIKFIRTESVWEHMARMCVKTRRIDVARVCLGHMGHARTARAIRRTVVRGDTTELQIARLAVELGMTEEAVGLFQKADRWDEVNRLFQAQGKWPEAIEVAEKHDRIHLRHTHYNYAKYLESVGAIEKAIENYEKANTHHFEVPRMLCDEPKVLEFYIRKKSEREMYKWWAHFLESQGDMATAKIYYQSADDFLSVVRIECHNGQVQEAAKIVDQSDSRAAAFHLALHLEAMGDSNGAVHYFGTAGAFSNAIRLAKEQNMVDRLVNLALMAGGAELVEAADFYKDLPGHADKVVMLYHKAGLIGRALDFAFRTGQFGALDLIAQDLNENSDPSVLIRAAEFFSANQQESQAVRLLVHAKKYSEAVKLCSDKNVQITDELDTFLTPNKMESLSSVERCNLLEQIARCSLQQGNYHFAAKKFTQAGNKLEAMRALLKSGDSQRVILFAQTARIGDIYRMAGNYLQSLNWKEDARLMRQIEAFYVKAGAMDLLSNFYESCAQVEIDEFHDYEKAAAAYGEALKCLTKKLDEEDGKDKRYLLERREKLRQTLDLIAHFNEIKGLYETDPGESIRQLDELVEKTGINEHIRLGDIYALMVAHNFKRENYRKAWQLIEHCEQRLKPRVDMRRFLQRKILDRICDELGILRMTTGEGDVVGEAEDEGAVEYSHALRRRMRDDEGAPRGREWTDGGGG